MFYKEAARLWHALEALRAGYAQGAPALQPLVQALKALDMCVEHTATQALASNLRTLLSAAVRYSLQPSADLKWHSEQYAISLVPIATTLHSSFALRSEHETLAAEHGTPFTILKLKLKLKSTGRCLMVNVVRFWPFEWSRVE